MTALRLMPAADVPAAELHAAFRAAFADYLLGPFELPLAHWPRFTGRQGADLRASRVALKDGKLLAFALAAPRADIPCWRLATMGALPAARGSGAAQALLDDFIARAAAAGCAQVELECFAQNERALRLYRSRGFEAVHELHGYAGEPAVAASPACAGGRHEVAGVALEDAYAWLERVSRERGDLPLQVTPVSLRAQPVALGAWRSGRAQLVAGESGQGTLTFYSLVDEDPAQAGARALAIHAMQLHPQHAIAVPQLQRADLGGAALTRLGLRRLPLHQLLMRRTV